MMLTHIVFFKLKDDNPDNTVALANILRDMKDKIAELAEIEVGVDIARSERAYDVSLLTRFRSESDFTAYREHPDHLAVLSYVAKHCVDTKVVDYRE